MKISVILPTKGFAKTAEKVLQALQKQTHAPDEVVIIDSSSNENIKNLITKFNEELNIIYFHSKINLYPGEARNKGIELSKHEVIAFIDAKTIPSPEWLKEGFKKIIKNEVDVVFGSTVYKAETEIQKVFQASIFGKKPVLTTPGSMLKKSTLIKTGNFVEGVRASEDQDWRNRIYDMDLTTGINEQSYLEYHSISKTLLSEFKRNFIYQLHTAKTDAQTNSKIFIFGVFITFLTLLAPSWNLLIGWKISYFYIPNITKIYLSTLMLVFFIMLIFYQKKIKKIMLRFMLVATAIASFYVVYRWNGQISKSIDFIIYFPHITKIYISFLFLSGFLYRGLISPIKKGVQLRDLIPFWWVKVGFICFLIDLIKLPGYIIGAISVLYRMSLKAIKQNI